MSHVVGRGRYAREVYPRSSGANLTQIRWSPGGGGTVRTWDEVLGAVKGSTTPISIWLDPDLTYAIPGGAFDLRGASFEAGRTTSHTAILRVEDGAFVKNLSSIAGDMILRGASSQPCMGYDGDFGFFTISQIAQVANTTSTPMIKVPSGVTLAVLFDEIARGSGPFVDVASGGILGILVHELALVIDDNFATGTAGSGLAFLHDGSLFFPTFAGFTNPINIPFGQDGGYGPKPFRPVGLFQPVKTGCAYFDTTIGKMIWYDGTQWIDAAGAPA